MQSCIYEGWIRHRRFSPVPHDFRYGLYLAYLDLDELDEVFRGRLLWSAGRPNLVWMRRADYLGDPAVPLREAVEREVEARLGSRPEGPVRLLAHLRTFGHCFNPVSFYYCFDASGERVDAVLAEVTNTPWKERHRYLLLRGDGGGDALRARQEKEFHVSPFLAMEYRYEFRFSTPGATLAVHMENRERDTDRRVFDATLGLRRREIASGALARVLLRYPFMTLRVVQGIHWQALKLWLKRVRVHDHPAGRAADPGAGP